MGEMKQSVFFHYSRGNIESLIGIANDSTVDEEDRDEAKRFIKELQKRKEEKGKEKELEEK